MNALFLLSNQSILVRKKIPLLRLCVTQNALQLPFFFFLLFLIPSAVF